MKNLEFGKYWVLSTAHLTEKESNKLIYNNNNNNNRKNFPLVVYLFEEGYFVHVPSYNAKDFKNFIKQVKAYRFTKQFIKILHCAKDNDCQFIKFDRDGDKVKGLKVFNW